MIRRGALGASTGCLAVVVILLLPPAAPGSANAAPAPATPGVGPATALTVDDLVDPIGLAPADVQFSWHVNDSRRGALQTAYRIVVTRVSATGVPAGTPAWDTGEVMSSQQTAIPYGGESLASDAAYRWTVQTWSATDGPSPLAPSATFEIGLDANPEQSLVAGSHGWQADWIRRAADDTAEYDQYTYARREFSLTASPVVRARVFVSADQQYELSVNGVRAGKGPAFSYPDSQYYETLDVTHLLHPGAANALGVLTHWDGATKGHPAGTPGLIAQLEVTHADGTTEQVTTDGTWKVLRGNWTLGSQRDLEGDQVDYVENVDGAHAPLGWDQPGYDDHAWTPATVLGPAGTAPWTQLISVRTRTVETPLRAVSLRTLANGSVVVDFGRIYAAVPTVTFHHGRPGRTIAMHAGDLLDAHPARGPAGQVSVVHGVQHTNLAYSYVQRGGVETFQPFDYLGFRYLQIDHPGETLRAQDVVAFVRHTALPAEPAATLRSSSPTIDAEFALGAHSALYTAQEQFVDTPTREKGPWLWDGFNESQTAMAAFDEQNLTRKSLLEFAQSQARYWPQGRINKIYPTGLGAQDINEFTEIYPEWVWQYWLHTGDRALLEQVYPTLVNVAGYVQAAVDPGTGLVTSLPATNVYYGYPVVTRLNVLGVDVFARTADVAEALGRPPSEVNDERARQTALTQAINTRLTRPDGVYVDGLQANGTPVNAASQEMSTAAVAYGIVPAGRLGHVATYAAGLGMQNPPRTAAELLATLRLAGLGPELVRRLTDAKSPGWANILAQGATFTWEVWTPSDANGDSLSHGWGSNVLVEIQRAVLGVQPAQPGYATVDVSPPVAGLSSASGQVPTPRGVITVAWRRAGRRLTLGLTVPANMTAVVHLPAHARVTERGVPLDHVAGIGGIDTAADGTLAARVGGGQYQLVAS